MAVAHKNPPPPPPDWKVFEEDLIEIKDLRVHGCVPAFSMTTL